MVFLPLMLIWLRDPMYFNASSRWAMVALAVSIGLLAPELTSEKQGNAAAAADFDRSTTAITPMGSERGLPATSVSHGSSLVREGTRLTNRVGQFSRSESGWYFTPAQTDLATAQGAWPASNNAANPAVSQPRSATLSRVRVLENLALQRVAEVIQQDPSDNRWVIDGVFTEFFGENRLLMVLAVRAPIDDESQR